MYIHTHTAAESSEWLIASHIETDKQSLCLCGCWLIPSARIARPLCSSTRRLSACPCIHSTSQRSTGRKRPAGGERVPAVFLRRSVLPTTARLCMHETKATENVKGVSSLSRQLRGVAVKGKQNSFSRCFLLFRRFRRRRSFSHPCALARSLAARSPPPPPPPPPPWWELLVPHATKKPLAGRARKLCFKTLDFCKTFYE